jgi:hypothetical protein
VPIVRTYEVEVMVVRIDLYDARSGQPVWSASAESGSDKDSPRERESACAILCTRRSAAILPVNR